MQTIEITTAQNVVIQLNPASMAERIFAFVIDLILMMIVFGILNSLFAFLTHDGELAQMVAMFPLMFYSLLFERFNDGQSPGKMALGIKVISVDGSQPEGIDLFKRWSIRLIDLWFSLGFIALITSGSSEKGQRIGDKVANTFVLKKGKTNRYRLDDIISLARSENYQAKYPEVVALHENQVITIKRLINRSEQNKGNENYRGLIVNTSETLQKKLDIIRKEKSHDAFLKQIIRDYVILTR
ncbi:MAG: RDD family protein [Bacteroidetes bacterium]|nr:RDD family protein [Bacteroidota bacterium]